MKNIATDQILAFSWFDIWYINQPIVSYSFVHLKRVCNAKVLSRYMYLRLWSLEDLSQNTPPLQTSFVYIRGLLKRLNKLMMQAYVYISLDYDCDLVNGAKVTRHMVCKNMSFAMFRNAKKHPKMKQNGERDEMSNLFLV